MHSKKLFLFTAFVIILVISSVAWLFFGGTEDVAGENLAIDILPVYSNNSDIFHLDKLKDMYVLNRAEYVKRHFPNFDRRIAAYLKDPSIVKLFGETGEIIRVELYYGAEKDLRAYDKDGVLHNGHIKEELIAAVFFKGVEDPRFLIIRCFNGLFDLSEKHSLVKLHEYITKLFFVINKGESLCTHVDYLTAIYLAEIFDLPIKKRPIDSRIFVRLSPLAAKLLVADTDRNLVQVLVQPGDVFNLEKMTYNGRNAVYK